MAEGWWSLHLFFLFVCFAFVFSVFFSFYAMHLTQFFFLRKEQVFFNFIIC